MISSNSAQMDHSSVVGHLHRLPDTGFLAFHHTQFISSVVNAKRDNLISWQPLPADTDIRTYNSLTVPSKILKSSDTYNGYLEKQSLVDKAKGKQSKSLVLCSPGAFVVEEENQEESLASFFLSLVAQAQYVERRHRDGHAVMQQTLLRHVWIYDLQNKSSFNHLFNL